MYLNPPPPLPKVYNNNMYLIYLSYIYVNIQTKTFPTVINQPKKINLKLPINIIRKSSFFYITESI